MQASDHDSDGDVMLQLSSAKLWGRTEAQARNNSRACASCFTCKVSEGRLVSYLVMALASCFDPYHVADFSANLQHRCEPNDSFYQRVCVGDLDQTGGGEWLQDAFDPLFLTRWAHRFADDANGWGNLTADGRRMQTLADDWLHPAMGSAARALETLRQGDGDRKPSPPERTAADSE